MSISGVKRRKQFPRYYFGYQTSKKKGQYRIVFETMLILVGVFITSYVVSNFRNVQSTATTLATEDNFNSVANDIIIGVVKASHITSGVVRIEVPQKISDKVYKIRLDGNRNAVSVVSLEGPGIAITRQIFNIGQVNRIIISEVVSSARVVEIVAEDGTIRLRRGT